MNQCHAIFEASDRTVGLCVCACVCVCVLEGWGIENGAVISVLSLNCLETIYKPTFFGLSLKF